jgi:hypothetical protein
MNYESCIVIDAHNIRLIIIIRNIRYFINYVGKCPARDDYDFNETKSFNNFILDTFQG